MTVIRFRSMEQIAFAELVEEGKALERQCNFVVTNEDDDKTPLSSPTNIIVFPTANPFDLAMEIEEDLELAALVLERQNDLRIVVDLDDL